MEAYWTINIYNQDSRILEIGNEIYLRLLKGNQIIPSSSLNICEFIFIQERRKKEQIFKQMF